MNPLSNTQRHIVQKTTITLVLATLLWVSLLIFGASQAKDTLGLYEVAFGPVVLNEIAQLASSNGRIVSFSFETGLLWFFVFWAAVGVSLGWFAGTRPEKTKR